MELFFYLAEKAHAFLAKDLFLFGKSAVTGGTVLFITAGLTLTWFLAIIFQRWVLAKLALFEAFNDVARKRVAQFGRWFIFLTGSVWILDVSELDVTAVEIISYADRFLNASFVHIGKTQITLWTVIYVLSLWLGLILITNRMQLWCSTKLLTRSGMEIGTSHAISVIAKYIVVSIGFVVILQSAGVDLSALTVLAGALGLGLSFGLQNITSNLVSGLIVLIERPIRVGDRIEVSGVTGDVTKIALRATTICTNDNIDIIVPNSEFISGNVINWSHSSQDVRVSIEVGVSYSSNPDLVQNILLKVSNEHAGVLSTPAPTAIFKSFGDSALEFVLRVSTREYAKTPGILKSELNFAILKEFRSNEIEIPFPQRDLNIRSSASTENFVQKRS